MRTHIAMTIVAAVVATALAEGECFSDPESPGFLLPPGSLEATDPAYGNCKPGWYCPFLDPNNVSATWPRACPPSDECVETRIRGEFCAPQGPFEPTPCLGGNYCPNARTILRCPSGYYCPLGSTYPRKCSPFAHCPGGTSNEYDMVGILVVFLVDAALVLLFAIYRHLYRKKVTEDEDKLAKEQEEMSKMESADVEEGKTTLWGSLTQPGSGPGKNLQPLFSYFSKARGTGDAVTFRFSNLSVKIPAADVVGDHGPATTTASPMSVPSPKTGAEPAVNGPQDKTLLRSVNGKFRPGTVTAIMGPSGAGKTVLLNTLLNKNANSWKQEGDLHVNNTLSISDIRHVVGFVPQDDVLHPELTVEQNLYYSSETRLPDYFTAEERDALRVEIIKVLGLSQARHVQIGDESSRGVSGGQRKRCSIGVELAACPTALFLDEPTTGLDAATALDLCNLLQRLSVGTQSTVVMVVHQPRVEIWNALDQVLLLAPGGRTVYQGPQVDAKKYFQDALGLDFSFGNPADIILDGIAAQADLAVEMWDARLQMQSSGTHAVHVASSPSEPIAVDEPTSTTTKAPAGQEEEQGMSALPGQVEGEDAAAEPDAGSTERQEENEDEADEEPVVAGGGGHDTSSNPYSRRSPATLHLVAADEDETAKTAGVIPPPRGASFPRQIYLAAHRQFVKINHNAVMSILDILLVAVCCIVMSTPKVRQEFIGIVKGVYALVAPKHKMYSLPMISMFYMLAIASGVAPLGVRTFGSDMTRYWREASNGHNKLAYYLGYSAVDFLRNVVSSLHFAVIAYLMGEPFQGFWVFWVWFIFLFIIVDAQSAGLSMFLRPDTAPVMATIIAIFMGLLNGYANIPMIGPASYSWWATEGIMHREMEVTKQVWSIEAMEDLAPWNLDRLNMDYVMLVVIYLVYRVIGFLLLVLLNREKQR